MNIKIQCPCGAKYVLEISAENLANPVRFVCQQCGVDDSAAINEIVRQQFAAPAAPKPAPVKVVVPSVTREGAVPPAPAPVAHPTPTAVAVPTEPGVAICHRHSDQPATNNCLVCKKPICPECMRLFGYVCSAYCAGQAERAGVELPVYEFQKSVVEAKFWQKVRWAVAAILVFLALLAAAGLWYNFVLSRPKAAFTVKFPEKSEEGFCKFMANDQAVIRHGNRLARYDLTKRKEVWSTPLLDPQKLEEYAAAQVDAEQFAAENWKLRKAKLKAEGRLSRFDELRDDEDEPRSEAEQLAQAREQIQDSQLRQLRFHFENSDVWVVYTNKVVHLDWKTGTMDKEIPLQGDLDRVIPHEGSLLALSEAPLGEKILTHVRLPAGEAQTTSIKPDQQNATNLARMKLPGANIPLRAMTVHFDMDFVDGESDRYFRSAAGTYLLNTGPNVAEMKVDMVEEKVTQHRTMKERPKTSVLDGAVSVTQTAEVANEVLNEMQEQRTGGVRFEDESRYLVTLRRKLATGTVPDWVSEVTGPPQLFSLKTVDVLVAGKTMIVLDKSNQKRWESKLAYTVPRHRRIDDEIWDAEDDSDDFMPCVERGNTLYFFDQGVLAAFDIATGNPHWRLPSVGVSGLRFDDKGMMFVITTSGQQEDIKYIDQIDVTRKTVPMLMKVDPKIGKVIWTLRQTGETCLFSGKFFYAFEYSGGGGTRFGREVKAHARIYRLHPRDGRVIWDHIEQGMPIDMDFRDNTILALFPTELRFLKFMSM